MGRSAYLLIGTHHFGREFHGRTIQGIKPRLHLHHIGRAETFAPHNIEMTGTRLAIGINFIRLTGCRQHSPTMINLGQTDFWLDGVIQIMVAQRLRRLGITAGTVTTLYHKILDDPMEEQRVIVVGLDQAQEIVAMERGLVVELQTDIARGGLQQHLVTFLGLELADCHSAEDQQ